MNNLVKLPKLFLKFKERLNKIFFSKKDKNSAPTRNGVDTNDLPKRIGETKCSFTGKKIKSKSFIRRHLFPFWPLLIALTLLFLPGNSYYETLMLSFELFPVVDNSSWILPSLPPLLVRSLTGEAPIYAHSVLLADYDSGQVLYQKNSDQSWPPASLTKIMTALIILEEIPLDQILTVNQTQGLGRVVGLQSRQQFKVGDLVYALLVMSGNDVAYILANNYPGKEVAFLARMNERAGQLGLEKTHFKNPHGLDEPGHYSSARDLFLLTNYALKNDHFAEIIKRGNGQICDLAGNGCYQIETTNELLVFPGMLGVKTGYTDEAGGCFVGFWEQEGRRFISVVLGSGNRFLETQNLLAWGLASFSPQEVSLLDFLD
ncbi:MAG: D-alanyl-D-alanine carboxypeptidase [Candidatus Shapirobacteria bacterium]|nr:D-alanyl-D-alanine carboxypeptidase [Candidatus Shapirobacteria bacterium]